MQISNDKIINSYRELLPIFQRALDKVLKLSNKNNLKQIFPDTTPRVIGRIKSEESALQKILRKINTDVEFSKIAGQWIKNEDYKELFINENGIGDVVGIRLIFPYIIDYDDIIDKYVTNFLVREHKFSVIKGRDVKNKPSGYVSTHSHVWVPVTYERKKFRVPLEIQITSEMANAWMEKQHELIYKSQNIDLNTYEYLKELYSMLGDMTRLLESIIFLPDKHKKSVT